jgi:hypothetical protein
MSVKALVLGALPRRFEGPWIPLGAGTRWKLDAPKQIIPHMEIETREPDAVHSGQAGMEIEAREVRIKLVEGIENIGLKAISVIVRRIR